MVLISFSYDWNSSWTSTEERPWLIAVVVVSATLWFGSVVVTAFFYSWFAVGDACGFQQAVITVNLLAAVLYTALALSSFAPHGTLLTSSVMFAYNTFTMYGALSADPSACNRSGVSLTAFSTWGLVITAVTLCWSAFSLSRTTLFGEGRPALDVTTEADPPADAEQASQPIGHLDEEQMATLRFSNAQFHLLMALSSLYITMAVSGWATAIPNDESNSSQRGVGAPVMWVALTTTWATSTRARPLDCVSAPLANARLHSPPVPVDAVRPEVSPRSGLWRRYQRIINGRRSVTYGAKHVALKRLPIIVEGDRPNQDAATLKQASESADRRVTPVGTPLPGHSPNRSSPHGGRRRAGRSTI